MNYYPFHIGDFRSGTVNMSRQARWIYRDMMDVYYDVEAPLSLDIDVLCDSLGVETADERAIVERLLRFKFIKTDDGYRHDVCEQVIAMKTMALRNEISLSTSASAAQAVRPRLAQRASAAATLA